MACESSGGGCLECYASEVLKVASRGLILIMRRLALLNIPE